MRLFKRGAIYWFELVFDGQRIQKSTRSKNKGVAGEVLSTFHSALIKGDAGITERKRLPTLSGAMEGFLKWSAREHHAHPRTSMRYVTSSKPLLAFFGNVAADKISSADVELYKTQRSGATGKRTARPLRPATVNRELACLRAMYNHLAKAHPQLRNPVSKVKFLAEENQQDRVLTFAEQAAYLKAATPIVRDVAGLILETGLRPEEVYSLRGANIDRDEGYLKIVASKTPAGKRRIELTPEARRIVSARMSESDSVYLFPCKGDPTRHIPKVSNAHDRAVAASKVAPFKLYCCRHTFATRAAEAGVDLATLAAILGHSRLQMVLRYAHPTQAHQSSAMQKFAAHNATREAKEKAAGSGLKIMNRVG